MGTVTLRTRATACQPTFLGVRSLALGSDHLSAWYDAVEALTAVVTLTVVFTSRVVNDCVNVIIRPFPTRTAITNLTSSTSVERWITISGMTACSPWSVTTRSSQRYSMKCSI